MTGFSASLNKLIPLGVGAAAVVAAIAVGARSTDCGSST